MVVNLWHLVLFHMAQFDYEVIIFHVEVVFSRYVYLVKGLLAYFVMLIL